MGKGWSSTVSVAAYGSFTQAGFYADALAGYAYSNNQMQRQLQIPGLQLRTANGSTGANQFLGQVETGYRLGIYAPAMASITPFARLQASSVNQAAFSEWGADSLSLNVAQQTTTSLRTTFGADLAGAIALGDARTHAAARQCGDRLPGQHHRRGRHASLPALRRRDRIGLRQPRHQRRRPASSTTAGSA